MNRIVTLSIAGFLAGGMVAEAQTATDPNEGLRLTPGSSNTYTLSWWGKSGRTYFVQHSEDMLNWIYVPVFIETGSDAIKSWGTTSTGGKFFLRLRHSDIATGNPLTADFDGDGISNATELSNGGDPLMVDTDGDGLDDGWEVQHFGSLAQSATGDFDHDGQKNLAEHQLRTSPAIAFDRGGVDYDSDGVSDITELAQGRMSSAGAIADSSGSVNLEIFTPFTDQ